MPFYRSIVLISFVLIASACSDEIKQEAQKVLPQELVELIPVADHEESDEYQVEDTQAKPVVPSVIRKCVIDGKTTFTDQPCPGDSEKGFQLSEMNVMEKQEYQFKADPSLYASNYSSAKWYEDTVGYIEAKRVAKKYGVPILIYGYTDWCGYCRAMEQNYFTDANVKSKLQQFVKVRLNPEHSDADRQLFKSWGGKGYPSVYVQHGDAAPKKIRNGNLKDRDSKPADPPHKFADRLQNELNV